MGECLSEYGCAWCDARTINPARNPVCMSLFETSACPLQTLPELTPRLPEEPFPKCDARCAAIGLRDPCIDAPGCGWCGAIGRCVSGSYVRGPCLDCPGGWAFRYGSQCPPGFGGEAEAKAGGDCSDCKCQNVGACTMRGDCQCPDTHTGTLCQTPKTRVDACHGHGDWDLESDDCVCDDGYVGVGDNKCAFACDPVATCGGKGYCSELTGKCVCNSNAAGARCECTATPLTTYPFADPLKNQNEKEEGCCGYGFEPCPSISSNSGRCVLAPADSNKCPVFKEDNTTLVILVVLAGLFGGYLAAAVIAYCQTSPAPTCVVVARLPEVLQLRESLFKRSERDVSMPMFLEIEVPLTHNFWRVKRMIARRLKSQPNPEDMVLSYLGSELANKWRLSDGIACGDTVHVKLRLTETKVTDYVRKRYAFQARVKAYLTEDNIVTAAYALGMLIIIVALVAWPGDKDGRPGLAPPAPPAAPSLPPPMIIERVPPPSPPPPPPFPPPPPADWVAVALLQQTIAEVETSGELSTLSQINDTLPSYLTNATGGSVLSGSVYDDLVSFTRTESDTTLFYITREDAPLWLDQLPDFFDTEDPPAPYAVTYRTSCFPNLATQYSMTDNGVISYQPQPDLHGQDYMTYYGLVAPSIASDRGLVEAGLVDCDNMIESQCVTITMLANIVIDPRNDAPVAAAGEPVLYFTDSGDFVTMNDEVDTTTRNQLPAPQRLIRNLVGSDVDGDLLKYHITGQPTNGYAEIINENSFFYVPNPGFMGSDYFLYTVDDSRSNEEQYVLYDQAYVVVQVGLADGVPQALPSEFWVLEDTPLEGKLYRTPGLNSILPRLEYTVITAPAYGEVQIACGGAEATNVTSCAYAAGNAFFTYSPDANFFGNDSFVFGVHDTNAAAGTLSSSVVTIDVRPVNDVPDLQDQVLDATMNRDKNIYSFADADVTPLSVVVADADDVNFTMHLARVNGPELSGRFFARLDAFGRPTDEMEASVLSLNGVAVVGGTFQAYYMAPPLAHGMWTEQYSMRARDGSLVSNSSTLTLNVKCSPGFIAEADNFGTANTALGVCTSCPMGSISAGYDAVSCSKCPLGMFSGDALVGSCSLCPGGTYADTEGLVFCKACPLGSTSSVGAVSIDECYCAIGYYGTPGNCRPCPNLGLWGEMGKWTYCVEADLEVPLPQPGFYVVQADNPLEEPVAMRQCFPDVSCPGLKVSADDTSVDMIATGDWRADEAQCDDGYTNEGCDTCVEGYFRLNSRCEECPPLWQPWVYGFFMIALLLFAVLGPWFIAEQDSYYHIVTSAMTVVSYSQEIALFGRYYLHWDDSPRMRAVLKWAFLFQLNPEILAMECTQNVDFVIRWRSLMLLPAVLTLLAGAAVTAWFVLIGGQKVLAATNTLPVRRLQKLWVGVMRSAISLAMVMYAGLTVATLDMFVFHTSVTDGRDYLRAAPALRFGLMNKDEAWYQLLPGAVIAVVIYPVAILLSLAILFFYASQRWRKLWIREMVGWSSYAYRDETFWFRVVEMWRFLCFATLQIVAFKHDEAGGVTQALSALLVVALGMCFLLMRPYKRYRKKLLEFVILFSHGLVLLMSSISLAPESTEINAEAKAVFKEYVFGIIMVTYLVIFVDVAWSVVEELPTTQRLEMQIRATGKNWVVWFAKATGTPVQRWAKHPEFDEDAPVTSMFKPSAAGVLREMSNREVSSRDWTKDDRCAFAKSVNSLLKHRLINIRLGRRDVHLASYPDLFQPQIRHAMLASAALEDTEHNRLVMTFTEKRLLRIVQITHRKFYKRINKKLISEDALNPLLERWLRCNCEGLEQDEDFDDGLLPRESQKSLFSQSSLKSFGRILSGKPGPVTEGMDDSTSSMVEMHQVLDMLPADDEIENSGAGPVTESTKKPARKSLQDSQPAPRALPSRQRSQKGYFANLDNVSLGKSSRQQSLKVAPKDGASVARGAEADDPDVIDLSFEQEVWEGRDYDGKVHFLRHEGFFDDLHREWDKHDDLDKKKSDMKELADDPETDDVEGGAVLPWHFRDAEDDEIVQDVPPAEIVVPDDDIDDEPLVVPKNEYEKEMRMIEKEKKKMIREQNRLRMNCCIHIHLPGETCSHGNVMPDPEILTEVIEREYDAGIVPGGPEQPDRLKKIEVMVNLSDTGEQVRQRVYEEMQYAKKEGFYDDGSGDVAPEVLNLTPDKINLVHKGRAVREPTALVDSHVRWRADVTLQGKRGGAGRSAAVLVMKDDLAKLGEPGTNTQTVVHHHTNTVINNNTHTEKNTKVQERVRQEVGIGARVEFKNQHTVRDLRQAAADARGLPFERTVLRYAQNQKEIINDSATLERKKVFTIDEVSIEEEIEDPRFVYHEVRRHIAFFETCFRVYSTVVVLDVVRDQSRKFVHTQTQLLMSEQQFVYMCTQADIGKKLTLNVNPVAAFKDVFAAVKADVNISSQMELLLEDEAELVGALAASKLNRLQRRIEHPNHLALDEFITAVVLLGWMTYGFRVPQTWTRGVARSLRFFVERVLRVGVLDVQASHDVLMQFAAARQAEGATSGAAKEAMVVFRKFARDSSEGMSLERWLECVEWLAAKSPAAEKYAALVFHTHIGQSKGEPPWVDEGCRNGRVHPIGEDPWQNEASLLTFPRFQVAFSEICFRIENAEGGSPRERQMRAFRNAMEREDISDSNANGETKHADNDAEDAIMRVYDPTHVATEKQTSIEKETIREVHHHHYHGDAKNEEPETKEELTEDDEEEKPEYGEVWVPPVKAARKRFKAAAMAATLLQQKQEVVETDDVVETVEVVEKEATPEKEEDPWRDAFGDAKERTRVGVKSQAEPIAAARRRRIVKKQVVVTTQQNVVKQGGRRVTSSTTNQSAKQSVVDIELAHRAKQHRVETSAYASVTKHHAGASSASTSTVKQALTSAAFVVDEEDSTDEEADEVEETIGTDAWKLQQEQRRNRYRITTSSTNTLYDVETVRRQRIEKEERAIRIQRHEKEKREKQERIWAEASEKVDSEAATATGLVNRRMKKFTEQIESGWQKDYAGKSTGLTAKKWDQV